MPDKSAVIFLFVLLTIIPAWAASPAGPNSVSKEPNSLNTLISNADKGDPNSQFELGIRYFEGNSVTRDFNEAVKWWTKAAKQDNVPAQYNLGVMYWSGAGVRQDYNQAAKWYTKAAQQGYPSAQFNLGAMFALGEGVAKDNIEAYKWVLLAGLNGYNSARMEKELTAQMTPAQIDEAQKQAQEFIAKKEKEKTAPALSK
jgi:TPR repeat protein